MGGSAKTNIYNYIYSCQSDVSVIKITTPSFFVYRYSMYYNYALITCK